MWYYDIDEADELNITEAIMMEAVGENLPRELDCLQSSRVSEVKRCITNHNKNVEAYRTG